MRVLVDTNILISASLSKFGNPYLAFIKAVSFPNHGVICQQILDELRLVFNRKFPTKLDLLEKFPALALPELEVLPTPTATLSEEMKIHDASDRPILRAAIAGGLDVIVTGDRGFLESGN